MGNTVLGNGPLPRRTPKYRIARQVPNPATVGAVASAVKRDNAIGRRAGWPEFDDRDSTMAGELALGFVDCGPNVRPAGVNVPIRELFRPDGTKRATVYPFGVTKHKRKRDGIRV